MKRFKLIGNYSSEELSANIHENYNEIVIPLTQNGKFLNFGMGHVTSVLRNNDVFPCEKAYDLIALALLVYMADTRISRKDHAQDSWTREIYIELPVESPDVWNKNVDRLNRMLKFLTGDIWKVSFTERTIVLNFGEGKKTEAFDAISLFQAGWTV